MRIGDRLISAGLITEEQLNHALKAQKEQTERKKILTILLELGHLTKEKLFKFFVDKCKSGSINLDTMVADFPASEDEVLALISHELDMELIDLDHVAIDNRVVDYVPFMQIKKYLAFPIKEDESQIYVVLFDPFNFETKEFFQRTIRKKTITFVFARKEQVSRNLARIELNDSVKDLVGKIRREMKSTMGGDVESGESSSIMKLIETIFAHAVNTGSSDVHIEANEDNCVVRCRVDGVLNESFNFDKDMYPPLASRLKLLSDLDIAEKRKPQDGRFSSTINGKEYDFRISTLPIITGESVVTRILDKSKVLVRLEDMGLSPHNYNRFQKAIKSPYGIVFVTGPTGSGKTTTLYASLNAIKGVGHKIITVEDPVEYQMGLIQQVMVNEKAGLSFSAALKSILRQDPDIIMIGEIRDKETMKIAVQAALTGHLVLSTLHTNDAISSISRLQDMGIESFFIGSSMAGIEAQRLVRRLCPHCKYEVEIADQILDELKPYLPNDYRFYKSRGCHECNNSGYAGRALICEVLLATESVKKLIINGASKEEITEEARKDGFISMFEDGLNKAIEGLTSIEEVYRVAKLP